MPSGKDVTVGGSGGGGGKRNGGGNMSSGSTGGAKKNAYCSFCRKSHRDVGPLVEGPGDVYICGDCVELCQSIVVQEKRRHPATGGPPAPPSEDVRATLDHLFPGEKEAKEVLVRAALDHYQPS